jgi:hypothetical protein
VTLQDYITQIEELVHDVSGVDWSTSEMTSYVNAARKRTALDLHNVRTLIQNATIIPGQVTPLGGTPVALGEQYPLNGGVCGGAITNVGSGYTSVPTVNIGAPPAGGTQATAIAVVTNQTVTQIQMTNWGAGYTAVPSMTITGGGGASAAATALAMTKAFDWASISVLNGNLRYMLSWVPFTWFQAFMRAYTLQFRPPAVWTIHDGANKIFLYPIPDQSYPVDIDQIILPDDLVAVTDVDTQVIPPEDDCVQYYGAYKALLKLQNFEQAEYYKKTYDARVNAMQVGRQTRRIISPYRTFYRRTARL